MSCVGERTADEMDNNLILFAFSYKIKPEPKTGTEVSVARCIFSDLDITDIRCGNSSDFYLDSIGICIESIP